MRVCKNENTIYFHLLSFRTFAFFSFALLSFVSLSFNLLHFMEKNQSYSLKRHCLFYIVIFTSISHEKYAGKAGWGWKVVWEVVLIKLKEHFHFACFILLIMSNRLMILKRWGKTEELAWAECSKLGLGNSYFTIWRKMQTESGNYIP